MEKQLQTLAWIVAIVVFIVLGYTIIDSHLEHKKWGKDNKKRTDDLDEKYEASLEENINTNKCIQRKIESGELNVLVVNEDRPSFSLDKKKIKKKK